MIHQLTGLQDHEQKTMQVADAVRGNQVQTDQLPSGYAAQPDP